MVLPCHFTPFQAYLFKKVATSFMLPTSALPYFSNSGRTNNPTGLWLILSDRLRLGIRHNLGTASSIADSNEKLPHRARTFVF
jgi:hypothetical protein